MIRSIAFITFSVFFVAAGSAFAAPSKGPTNASFYKPAAKKVQAGKVGSVIWWRNAPSNLRLRTASKSLILVYRSSSSFNKKKTPVSGTLWIPKGKAPKGGWPVISWGHGTTGAADACAPSRSKDSSGIGYTDYVLPQISAWLVKGYVVAMTDYEGLGTPGPHPYLIGSSEGNGVVDIVRASRQIDKGISNRWVAAGHSQGGHASLFAASLGKSRAPELSLRGVAAFAPANNLKTTVNFAASIYALNPNSISGLGALIVRSSTFANRQITTQGIMETNAYQHMSDLEKLCLGNPGLGSSTSFGQFAPGQLMKGFVSYDDNGTTKYHWDGVPMVQDALNTLDGNKMNSNQPISVPILIMQGTGDMTVPAFTTDTLVSQLEARGLGSVTYKKYNGVGHGGIVAAGLKNASDFFSARMAP